MEKLFEQVETTAPELLVEAQPLVGTCKWPGVQAAQVRAAAYLSADQSGILENLDVLRGGCKRNREGFRKFTDCSLATSEIPQHPPTRCVAKSVKDGVHPMCF